MAGEIDEAWIEQAIDRYRRLETMLVEFDQAAAAIEVTVSSADGLVEVRVTADGTITRVDISESAPARTARELSASVQSAVCAAADAARWAREKLHSDMFGEFRPLSPQPRSAR
jgi:DNA-binding protein YbaB